MSIRKSEFQKRNAEFVKRNEKTGLFCADSTKSRLIFLFSCSHWFPDQSRFLRCSGSSSGIISFVITCSISSSFARSSSEKRSSKRFTTSSRN